MDYFEIIIFLPSKNMKIWIYKYGWFRSKISTIEKYEKFELLRNSNPTVYKNMDQS